MRASLAGARSVFATSVEALHVRTLYVTTVLCEQHLKDSNAGGTHLRKVILQDTNMVIRLNVGDAQVSVPRKGMIRVMPNNRTGAVASSAAVVAC